jgi:alkanesulfonate monooxygenase SsuD/methylene tetrahydromethanopterin reductase-like flavin-dependent oxidoreductase (luciferase family)
MARSWRSIRTIGVRWCTARAISLPADYPTESRTGFGKAKPGPAVGLVGSYQNVAERLAEFRDAGISTFILAGSPHLEEALRVGQEVLPLVHAAPVREALTPVEVAVAQVA